MRLRLAVGAVGVAVAAWGAWLLLDQARATRPTELLTWGVGLVVAHDLLLAPVAAGIGIALVGRSGGPARRWLAAALFVAGCLVLVAAPLLLVPGVPAGPSSRPLDYPRNLLISLLAVSATAAIAMTATSPAVRRRLRRTGGRSAGERDEAPRSR